jgi:hypothetical protein
MLRCKNENPEAGSTAPEKPLLRLYVVGESSPIPDDWCGKHAFVVAASPEEAEALAMMSSAVEIPMTEPMVVGYDDSGWGDE